jgi:hypothetical protein
MNQKEVRLNGLSPTSVAMFEGVFGAILGLVVAVMYLIGGTIAYSDATNSLLQGLLLGMGLGAFALLIYPMLYFAIGWLIGIVHGFFINLVLQSSGGLALGVQTDADEDEAAEYTPSKAAPAFGERIERRPRK